jgi:hypothetical protein
VTPTAEQMCASAATPLQACFVDLAQEDGITAAQIAQLALSGAPWSGVGLQCSNGIYAFSGWFPGAWKAAGPSSANPAYGKTWFRFPYHYYVVGDDPGGQADTALGIIESSGGFDIGDLWMGVDIERGEQPAGVTAAQVEDGIEGFAERVLQRTGKRPILYAGSFTRELGIKSRMGCWALWFPEWEPTITWATVEAMGFDINTTLLWQDVGDGSNTAPPGYPHTTPIGAHLDISILVRANLPYADGLEWCRTHAGAQPV